MRKYNYIIMLFFMFVSLQLSASATSNEDKITNNFKRFDDLQKKLIIDQLHSQNNQVSINRSHSSGDLSKSLTQAGKVAAFAHSVELYHAEGVNALHSQGELYLPVSVSIPSQINLGQELLVSEDLVPLQIDMTEGHFILAQRFFKEGANYGLRTERNNALVVPNSELDAVRKRIYDEGLQAGKAEGPDWNSEQLAVEIEDETVINRSPQGFTVVTQTYTHNLAPEVMKKHFINNPVELYELAYKQGSKNKFDVINEYAHIILKKDTEKPFDLELATQLPYIKTDKKLLVTSEATVSLGLALQVDPVLAYKSGVKFGSELNHARINEYAHIILKAEMDAFKKEIYDQGLHAGKAEGPDWSSEQLAVKIEDKTVFSKHTGGSLTINQICTDQIPSESMKSIFMKEPAELYEIAYKQGCEHKLDLIKKHAHIVLKEDSQRMIEVNTELKIPYVTKEAIHTVSQTVMSLLEEELQADPVKAWEKAFESGYKSSYDCIKERAHIIFKTEMDAFKKEIYDQGLHAGKKYMISLPKASALKQRAYKRGLQAGKKDMIALAQASALKQSACKRDLQIEKSEDYADKEMESSFMKGFKMKLRRNVMIRAGKIK